MALNVLLVFAGIGAIIFVGFLGSMLFDRTKIPDVLILIFIGLFLGPILGMYNKGLLDMPEFATGLRQIAPYFTSLALVIILFDGGLNLKLEKVMSSLGVSILHTGIAFIGTMFVTAVLCYYFLGITNVVIGLLLGCILGGISSAVVLPILGGISAKDETKTILTLESVLSDVLCIVTALILIEVLKGSTTDTGGLIQDLLSTFILAGVIGLLFGIAWLGVLKRVHGRPFSFMVTIAALLILYAGVEYIQVSGAIAALVFGLVLSNKDEIARMFKIQTKFVFDEKIKEFHSEVSFLIRTFFFVYLGITFVFTFTTWDYTTLLPFNLTLPVAITGTPIVYFVFILILIFIGIFVVRYIASTVTTRIREELKPDKSFLYAMLPRGLAAAVLAALPFAISEFNPASSDFNLAYANTIGPHQELYINVAFCMIVITVIGTTIGVSSIERSRKKALEAEQNGEPEWSERSRMFRKHGGDVPPPETEEWRPAEKKKATSKKPIIRVHPQPPSSPPPQKNQRFAKVPIARQAKPSKPHPLAKRADETKAKKPVLRKKP